MSKILKLDPSVDLWLTYSWSNNNHGICGHTYEVIDYFYILKKFFKVGILLCEDINWSTFEKSIKTKYNFNDNEIEEYKSSIVFANRPSLLQGKNILFTDGGIVNNQDKTLLFDNVLYFACGNREVKDNDKSNTWILQDYRVYGLVKKGGINYKKRILFDKLKTIEKSQNNLLLYATKNCRQIENFKEFEVYNKNIIAITNKENQPQPIEGIEFLIPPVENLFERFDTYVYTPVPRKWDCSPRFLAECQFYKKNIIYHNIDYWDIDHGLRVRKWDIENDFSSLYLTADDDIVNILRSIL